MLGQTPREHLVGALVIERIDPRGSGVRDDVAVELDHDERCPEKVWRAQSPVRRVKVRCVTPLGVLTD